METGRTNVLKSRTSLAVALGLALATAATAAFAFTGEHLATHAQISMAQARVIALKAFSGKIVAEELEHEAGGSGLRYSFDIQRGIATQEVGVDANTGKLLENDGQGPNPD